MNENYHTQIRFVDLKELKEKKSDRGPEWVQLTEFVEKDQLEQDFGGSMFFGSFIQFKQHPSRI
jgi:hypothetical protein